MRGRHCVVEDYGKENIDKSKISIHSSPTSGTFILSGKVLFACTGRSSILSGTQLFALCILRLNVLLKHFMRKIQGNI